MVRRVLPALMVLTLFAPLATAQSRRPSQRNPVHVHVSEAGRYKAHFPEKPRASSKTLSVGYAGQAVLVYSERATGPNSGVYAVTFCDYPEEFVHLRPEAILKGVRDGLKGKDGEIVKEEKVLTRSGEMMEYRIEAGEKAIRVRVILDGHRLYQAMVAGSEHALKHPQVDDFLSSFELQR